MIIELIGTPGVGKSTLLPTAISALRERGIEALTVVDAARPFVKRTFLGKAVCRVTPTVVRDGVLWQVFLFLSLLYRFRFMAQHPELIWCVLSSQLHRPPESSRRERKVLHWFFRMVGNYEFLRSRTRPNEALLFDEGFVHRVVQFYASVIEQPSREKISGYVNLLPKPDYVVFVDAPRQACENRIRNRGIWNWLQRKSQKDITTFVAHCRACVYLAVDQICRSGCTVIAINNSADALAPARKALRSALAVIPLNVNGQVYR